MTKWKSTWVTNQGQISEGMFCKQGRRGSTSRTVLRHFNYIDNSLVTRREEFYRVSVCVWSRNPEKGGQRSILDYKRLSMNEMNTWILTLKQVVYIQLPLTYKTLITVFCFLNPSFRLYRITASVQKSSTCFSSAKIENHFVFPKYLHEIWRESTPHIRGNIEWWFKNQSKK
jgi:hypothetical protein